MYLLDVRAQLIVAVRSVAVHYPIIVTTRHEVLSLMVIDHARSDSCDHLSNKQDRSSKSALHYTVGDELNGMTPIIIAPRIDK